MTWQDRLKEGAYIAPSGDRFVFAYEDLSRSFDKKTSGHDFPGVDGTFVQDNGRTGRKYPLTAYFAGPECDTEADAFEDALGQTGRGRLEHPIYGTVDVVPFGTITRNDALKSAANQSIVEVTFWETIPLIYPIPQADPTSIILDTVSGVGEGLVEIPRLSKFQEFKAKFGAALDAVKSVLGAIAELKNAVETAVRKAKAFLDEGVEGILGAVQLVMDIMALPSTIVGGFKAKFSLYKAMLSQMIGSGKDTADFEVSRIFASAAVSGLVVIAVESEFSTSGEALLAAEGVLNALDDVNTWSDSETESLGLLDTGESYQKLQESVALTAGYLIEISFTLKKERRVVLTRSRTIIDLAAELYGEVDSILDFFINSNDFSGSEIIEIPKGREVLYYV